MAISLITFLNIIIVTVAYEPRSYSIFVCIMNRCLRSRETLSLHFVQLNKFYFDKNIVVHNKYITVCLFQIQSQSVVKIEKVEV